MSPRQIIDCGDGIEVHLCAGELDEDKRRGIVMLGRAAGRLLAQEPNVECGTCGRMAFVDPCPRCYAEDVGS